MAFDASKTMKLGSALRNRPTYMCNVNIEKAPIPTCLENDLIHLIKYLLHFLEGAPKHEDCRLQGGGQEDAAQTTRHHYQCLEQAGVYIVHFDHSFPPSFGLIPPPCILRRGGRG